MLKFGSANNFCGQIGEHALKGIVKDHAARTQRRPANFAEQCAIREFESNVIKYVLTDLSNQLGVSAHNRARSVIKSELRGKFTLTLSETNRSIMLYPFSRQKPNACRARAVAPTCSARCAG